MVDLIIFLAPIEPEMWINESTSDPHISYALMIKFDIVGCLRRLTFYFETLNIQFLTAHPFQSFSNSIVTPFLRLHFLATLLYIQYIFRID